MNQFNDRVNPALSLRAGAEHDAAFSRFVDRSTAFATYQRRAGRWATAAPARL